MAKKYVVAVRVTEMFSFDTKQKRADFITAIVDDDENVVYATSEIDEVDGG